MAARPASAAAPTLASAVDAARLGQLDLDAATIQLDAVEPRHGRVGLISRRHLDEAKAPRAAGVSVGYDAGGFDRPEAGKGLMEALAGRRKRQTPDEELDGHEEDPFLAFPPLEDTDTGGTSGVIR